MGLGSVAVGLGSWSDWDVCVKLAMVAIWWWCWQDFFFVGSSSGGKKQR